MPWCNKCQNEKDSTEFYPSQIKHNICKMCWRSMPSQNKEGLKQYRIKNKDKIKKWKEDDRNRRREYILWAKAKDRAKQFNYEFTITVNDVVIPEFCPILDIPILIEAGTGRTGNGPSIDRIDNNKGYTKENIIVVSDRANSLKWNSTQEERVKLFNFYKKLMFNQILES